MSGRLPVANDFLSTISLSIIPPPSSQKPINILILLHGLGDTKESFTKLGQQLSLPETVCIALQAPNPLPFELGGFHWGDDLVFDQGTGEMDFDTGFRKSTDVILNHVLRVLIGKCQYQAQEILLFGFGQGGTAALAATTSTEVGEELNGVVSIGGPLPAESTRVGAKSRTPVLIVGGASQTLVTENVLVKLRSVFEFVEHRRWRRPGDSMPRSRDEMMPIMQFFARRLKSRQGVPDGSVELG